MTLFFSLPFEPIGHKNAFCSGHVALALADVVYQVFDPDLLHAPFLFSMMPLTDWLYARGRTWVDRNPSSPLYTHVVGSRNYDRCFPETLTTSFRCSAGLSSSKWRVR